MIKTKQEVIKEHPELFEERVGYEKLRIVSAKQEEEEMKELEVHDREIQKEGWYSTENIDFNKLATEIKEVSKNTWKLYKYISDSKELDMLNESFEHGHTSLKRHLLIIANLIVLEFQQKTGKNIAQ